MIWESRSGLLLLKSIWLYKRLLGPQTKLLCFQSRPIRVFSHSLGGLTGRSQTSAAAINDGTAISSTTPRGGGVQVRVRPSQPRRQHPLLVQQHQEEEEGKHLTIHNTTNANIINIQVIQSFANNHWTRVLVTQKDDDDDNEIMIEPYTPGSTIYESKSGGTWTKTTTTTSSSSSSSRTIKGDGSIKANISSSSQGLFRLIHSHIIIHFLPSGYPTTVSTGYTRYASTCFIASVAGSAGMVLSTQTLLVAVGVAGSTQSASIMAGALNWVLKDGVGQLGGVLFASQMGKSRRFDTNPKKWRMISAISLDMAALMEILSPMAPFYAVLPIACIANILKNIGFLTASASRAALHQSLAITGNLGDVTVKAGSQSIAAGLTGTTLGLSLSTILGHDVTSFAIGFCALAMFHQGFNYLSLKAVDLKHLNRHRLSLILHTFLQHDIILSPMEVAAKEIFIPFLKDDHHDQSNSWLLIGRDLHEFCPSGSLEFMNLLQACPNEKYVLCNDWGTKANHKVSLVFLDDATGVDIIRGMLHAYLLHSRWQKLALVDPMSDEIMVMDEITTTHQLAQEKLVSLLNSLAQQGWTTDTSVTNIESVDAYRYKIARRMPEDNKDA